MSGGSMNYIYSSLREEAYSEYDIEIRELMFDLSEYLHAEEWYRSGDTSKERWLDARNVFKKKWLRDYNCNHLLKEQIEKEIERVRKELLELVGETE